ncbi:MAG: phosphoribosylamine--glycine ligase [Rhodospirillaceae bacterium]|nr:phosphoribosylamine--glycine ligase [Rhodospirillaceae bacterium]
MRVLVVGGGGREHALCWAIAASPLCDALICAPGNAGIAEVAECVSVAAEDIDGIVALTKDRRIDFVVIGPEAPLVAGLADRLRAAGIKTFGPSAAAARLEGSKGFTRDLLARHGIPGAWYGRFTDASAAKAFIARKGAPIVVKADGLAAGKGVIICKTVGEANRAVDTIMTAKDFGAAGDEVVIEEFLEGEEASFFALIDGTTALPLAAAQDHKAVGDGDTGPNTGGMGAYSPAPVVDAAMQDRIMAEIVRPTMAAMAAAGTPFTGVLFCGLMITATGPRVIEFNVRFGDPECQALMMRLKSDILPALVAAADGQLSTFDLRWRDETALVVVMAAKGYPGVYRKGTPIAGLEAAAGVEGVQVFHAGTKATTIDGKAAITAQGGRVLGIAALGRTVAEAQSRAYRAVDLIRWPDGFYRRDIGWRALARESAPERPRATAR